VESHTGTGLAFCLLVVAPRHGGFLVALETETDLGLRHQLEEDVQHPQAGTQHRHSHDAGGHT